MAHRTLPRFARISATLSVFRWVSVVGLIIAALPVLSFRQATLEGIFSELDAVSVALSVMAVITASWSLMFVAGMLVEGAQTRLVNDGNEHRRATRDGGPLIAIVERNFGVPTRLAQGRLVIALSLPACLVLGMRSADGWRGWLAVPVGALVAWTLVELFSAPVRASLGERWKSEGKAVRAVEHVADVLTIWARPWFRMWRAIYTFLFDSWLSHRLGFDDVLEIDAHGKRRLAGNHFLAFSATFGACVVLGFFVVFSSPPDPLLGYQLPTAALVYVLMTLLVWVGGALDYHAARYGLPVSLVITGLIAGLALFSRFAEHDYDGEVLSPTGPGSVPPGLTPLEVASAGDGENLVVVCAAGGGILASGWTSLALTELVTERPRLLSELRVISAVSGGSVGTAYFLAGAHANTAVHEPDHTAWQVEWERLGAAIRDASVESSLEAVTFGLVFHDFPRLVTAGLTADWIERDRGDLLETQWHHAARTRFDGQASPPRLAELAEAIRAGRIPAPIFNTTAMEVGRRVMITPIRFAKDDAAEPRRAPTLSEYLMGEDSSAYVDLRLWTAARLSATFPYVTPAAHWEGAGEQAPGAPEHDGQVEDYRAAHHMIDGGYYDNYGVASALDWLRVVFEHRRSCNGCEHLPAFRRVAIVQLRPFPVAHAKDVKPSSNFIAALAGPAVGIASIRDGTATSRNDIELANFIDSWGERFRNELEIRSFAIQPSESDDPGPLSWRLTASQIRAMQRSWQDDEVQRSVSALMRFLEQ